MTLIQYKNENRRPGPQQNTVYIRSVFDRKQPSICHIHIVYSRIHSIHGDRNQSLGMQKLNSSHM
jgi:hypothetical protein